MHQTYKTGQWYFGMKAHIGVDSVTGLIHSASVTAANEHDSQQLGNLLHGNETRLYGDSAYRGQQDALKAKAPKAKDFTNKRASRNTPLCERDKETNTTKSRIRWNIRFSRSSASGALPRCVTGDWPRMRTKRLRSRR